MDPIARYLKALADPSSLIDKAELKKLDAQIAKAKDPVQRVKLRAQRAQAERVDLTTLEDEFVKAVPKWIAQEGLDADDARQAFDAEGVAKAVLDRIWGGKKASSTGTSSKKRTRISRETIEQAIPAKGDVFTTQDVVKETGASYATVRSVVADLVEAGKLKEHGPDPQHTGRGKPAVLYERKR